MRPWAMAMVLAGWLVARAAWADEAAVQRGYQALTGRAFVPAGWALSAYDEAWKQWGLEEKPVDYAQAFRERYGLHPAPYENGNLPMGLRQAQGLLGKGLTVDCLLCHGGSILGQSYIGLGNASLDLHAFFEEMSRASGTPLKPPFAYSNVRGTSEAGALAVYLLSHRDPDLKFRLKPLKAGPIRDDLCEDAPAWWLLHKKKTMYHTGTTNARSVRSIMQFMLGSATLSTFEREEATFRDIQAYLLSLRAPKYPFPIDRELAQQGERVFVQHCAKCHGTYGEKWTYPNRIVALDVIGTDRTRYEGLPVAIGEHYNRSWFAREKGGWFGHDYQVTASVGYQAPPLDGIWATAPYLHNGSVPTLYHLLNSKTRPKIFTRSYRTGAADYDSEQVGWKVQVLERGPDPSLPAIERRKVYDTTQPGRGNGGHTFGDPLSEPDRRAVIEYLKTL